MWTMAAPGDQPAFDLAIAVRAGENFSLRKKQREAKEKAISEGQYTKAESPVRLAKRVNRLLGAVQGRIALAAERFQPSPVSAVQAMPSEVHDLIRQGPIRPAM